MEEAAILCVNETGITPEVVKNYKPVEDTASKELLCFIKCSFEKMGYLKDDGSVCVETMKKENFPEGKEENKEKIYECIKGLDKIMTCEDVAALESCFVNNSK